MFLAVVAIAVAALISIDNSVTKIENRINSSRVIEDDGQENSIVKPVSSDPVVLHFND